MKAALAHIKKLDWVLLGAVIALFLLGLVMIYASPAERSNFYKQALFGGLALSTIVAMSVLDYRFFKHHKIALLSIYSVGVIVLGLLLLFGSAVRGVVSWLWLGPVGVQPVEVVKIAVLLVLAKFFCDRHIELYRLRHLVVSALYVFVPAGFVLVQPDLGSAFILIVSWIGMVLLSGIKIRQVVAIGSLGILVSSLLWVFALQPYQKERVLSFMDPNRDPLGSSYQTRQAVIAIGSGGFLGQGLGDGPQTRLGFLPEFRSDFIFAAIAEEWGFVGAVIVLGLWAIIFWRLWRIWLDAGNNFARLFVGGVFIILLAHVTVNIGANIGFLPVTGLPLPFVSYGGSNLLSNALALGIVMSIHVRSSRAYLMAKDDLESTTFGQSQLAT